MKLIAAISTAVLSFTLGAAVPVYAQQEQQNQQEEQKAKPAQDEKKAQPDKPAKQEEKSAPQQDKNTRPEEKNAQQNNSTKPEEKNAQQNKDAKPEERNARQDTNPKPTAEDAKQVKPAQSAQRGERNGGGGIPDDRFKANFGREHTFRVTQGDYSNHRFQYGGYSFGFVGGWPSNWLYTQDLFVVDINGVYYLCNPMYPGVNVELNVTL
jgi:hypothetical protein